MREMYFVNCWHLFREEKTEMWKADLLKAALDNMLDRTRSHGLLQSRTDRKPDREGGRGRFHPSHFGDWSEFIQLDVNTGLRCREMLFLEFDHGNWFWNRSGHS